MNKKLIAPLFLMGALLLGGCDGRQADEVSYNVSQEADNFNVIRRVAVIYEVNYMPESIIPFTITENK